MTVKGPESEFINLTTLQSDEACRILFKKGVLYGQAKSGFMANLNESSRYAYQWISEQTQTHVLKSLEQPVDVLWAWAKWDGHDAPIDLRRLGRSSESYWRIDLRVPRDQVLLSDFDSWHMVLGGWSCIDGEGNRPLARHDIEKSWAQIFHINESTSCVQATLLQIRSEWITRRSFHQSTK